MSQTRANKKIDIADTYKAAEKSDYFMREYDTIISKRGKTFSALGDFSANILVRFDCINCADSKCKNRRHSFKQPISKSAEFFTCGQLLLVKPSQAEILKQQAIAERSAKKAQDTRQKAVEEFRASVSKWLMRDDNALDYCEAACKVN